MRTVLRELAAGRGVAMLIDQHMLHRCRLRGLLRSPGGDDVGAGGAGASHRRAGDSRVCAAAAGGRYRFIYEHPSRRRARIRPMPSASSRSAAPTCSRCAPASRPVAVDASPVARSRPGLADEGTGADDVASEPRLMSAIRQRSWCGAPNWLGDAVMSLPALSDIHDAFRPSGHRRRRAPRRVPDLFRLTCPSSIGPISLPWLVNASGSSCDGEDAADFRSPIRALKRAIHARIPSRRRWASSAPPSPARWGYASDMRGALLSRASTGGGGARMQPASEALLLSASDPRPAKLRAGGTAGAGPTVHDWISVAASARTSDCGVTAAAAAGPLACSLQACHGTAKRWLLPWSIFARVADQARCAPRGGLL